MHDVTNETTLHQQLTHDMFIQQTKQLAQNTTTSQYSKQNTRY